MSFSNAVNFRYPRREPVAGRRQNLPGVYRALTTAGRGSEQPQRGGAAAGGLAMRIAGPNGPAAPAAGGAARRSSTGTFSLPEPGATATPAGTGAARTVAGIDALMALQGVG